MLRIHIKVILKFLAIIGLIIFILFKLLNLNPNFSIKVENINFGPADIFGQNDKDKNFTFDLKDMYKACVLAYKDDATNPCRILKKFGKYRIKNKSIYFLKTHKTGGTTFGGILSRIAQFVNISIRPYSYMLMPKTNIFLNYDYYYKEYTEKMFPKDLTFYVSIIRNPVSTYYSSYNYYDKYIGDTSKSEYIDYLANKKTDNNRLCSHLNSNCYHYGFVECLNTNPVNPKLITLKAKSIFDLMLLTEYFDEGIVLFKKLFNLNYVDVLYLKLNEGFMETDSPTEKMKNKINKESQCDKLLYDYYSKFYKAIQPFLKTEVDALRNKQKQLYHFCVEKKTYSYTESGYRITGYSLDKNLTKKEQNYCSSFINVP